MKIIFILTFIVLNISFSFAAKYTICNGKEFNTRIKMSINDTFNSSTPEYSITAFEVSSYVKGNAIDISEDGDESVLAYIDNNTIYCVSEEDIYLNSDLSYMFDKFINLKKVDLTFFNFDKIRKTNFMFGNCKYLSFLDMDNDTEIKLNEMEGMFFDCQSIVDLNLAMINTKNVKSFNSLFYNCKNLKNIIINPSIFKTDKVNNYNKMYYNCLSLKTNYNLKATDIKEEQYKVYTAPGSDFREGLLRDYDYDYVELILDNKIVKVDSLKSKIATSEYNTNISTSLNKDDLEKSKEYINISIASDSSLYSVVSDNRIGNNSNIKYDTNKYISDEVPILVEETTSVDRLVPKSKSTKSEIIDEEKQLNSKTDNLKSISTKSVIESDNQASTSGVKGILRPNYGDIVLEESSTIIESIDNETYKVDDEIINIDIGEIDKFDISNYYPLIILGIVFALILIGIIISNIKNKKDDF